MRILLDKGSAALLPSLRGLREITTAAAAAAPIIVAAAQRHDKDKNKDKEKERVVVIMGATGTGKSKLSIEVASRFPAEVVNTDKIQVYRGLDVTTNKMLPNERCGVPHHLLGDIDPAAGELPAAGFRSLAAAAISSIAARRRVPVLAGGSNSFLHALLEERHDPRFDPFAAAGAGECCRPRRLRYRCCFLWVDVEEGVLAEQLDRRVDDMVGMGMVGELEEYFAAEGEGAVERHPGLTKAIGVPEFWEYWKRGRTAAAHEAAVRAVKENTRRLAEEQVRKIKRLREMGWVMKRVDATETVKARLSRAGKAAETAAWERDVSMPGLETVARFLEEQDDAPQHNHQLAAVAAGC